MICSDFICWLSFALEVISWSAILLGSLLCIIGAIGLVRFPEFWSRLHAASVIESGGTILLLIGLTLQAGFTLIALKLIAILIFVFLTSPTATHAIASAAMVAGLVPNYQYRVQKQKEDKE